MDDVKMDGTFCFVCAPARTTIRAVVLRTACWSAHSMLACTGSDRSAARLERGGKLNQPNEAAEVAS